MGIFSGLFRSRDKPQNRTAGSAYSFFFGGSTAGKRVNERSAMQMTAVYSCVRILAEAVAGLPLHLYRYKEDGGKEKAIDHPLYLLLHDEPNPEMSSFVFRETLMTHLLLWGNAYAPVSYTHLTRVELVRMDDAQAPLAGTLGTVLGVDDTGSLLMRWDNGSGLNVVYGEDIVRKVGDRRAE